MTRHIQGEPQNLSSHHRYLNPCEFSQCQQCGHRNQYVRPYYRPWTRQGGQPFCQPSCRKVRDLLKREGEEQ